jgi:hypothetical protein
MCMFRTPGVHLQEDSCKKCRNGITYVQMYGTPWCIKVWFCNGRSSPVCGRACYVLPEDEPSGSKHVHVEDIVRN